MAQELEKGLKERLLAAGLAVATPKIVQAPEMKAPIVHQMPKPTEAPQIKPEPEKEPEMVFDPQTISSELHPIAHLESSFGKMMHHKPHSKGEMDTAIGAVGLKPVTAHETYLKSKSLQKLFPNFVDSKKFLHEMKANPQFYNAMASAAWNRMKKAVGGNPERTAYAWRHGVGAAHAVDDEAINKDPYVKKFTQLRSGKMEPSKQPTMSAVNKSEQMGKIIQALKKQEKENKLKIAQAAFKTTDGKVCPCGPIHDPSVLPEGSVVEEEGFVLRDGTFVNRAQATKLLHADHPLQSQEVDMTKAMPSPNLPKLGIENRRETPVTSDPKAIQTKTRVNG